jgi:hypothetical protein
VKGDRRGEPETSRPFVGFTPKYTEGYTNTRGVWWYRTDKETKRDGKGEGSLSIIIVPKSAANPTRGEPKEERVMSGDGTADGQHEGCYGI